MTRQWLLSALMSITGTSGQPARGNFEWVVNDAVKADAADGRGVFDVEIGGTVTVADCGDAVAEVWQVSLEKDLIGQRIERQLLRL